RRTTRGSSSFTAACANRPRRAASRLCVEEAPRAQVAPHRGCPGCVGRGCVPPAARRACKRRVDGRDDGRDDEEDAPAGPRCGRTDASIDAASDARPAAKDDKPVLPRYRGPLHVHGRVIAPDGTSFPVTSSVHLVLVDGDALNNTVLADAPLDGFGAFHFHAEP